MTYQIASFLLLLTIYIVAYREGKEYTSKYSTITRVEWKRYKPWIHFPRNINKVIVPALIHELFFWFVCMMNLILLFVKVDFILVFKINLVAFLLSTGYCLYVSCIYLYNIYTNSSRNIYIVFHEYGLSWNKLYSQKAILLHVDSTIQEGKHIGSSLCTVKLVRSNRELSGVLLKATQKNIECNSKVIISYLPGKDVKYPYIIL